jgi:hypothetical protein
MHPNIYYCWKEIRRYLQKTVNQLSNIDEPTQWSLFQKHHKTPQNESPVIRYSPDISFKS